MSKILAFILLSFVLAGCSLFSGSSPPPAPVAALGCAVETSVESGFAVQIGASLSCTNLSQIQADIVAKIGSLNLCAKVAPAQPAVPAVSAAKAEPIPLKGMVGDIVCPLAVNAAMGIGEGKIPASWGCSPASSAPLSSLQSVLTAACAAVVKI
jgi:hypothetical protein